MPLAPFPPLAPGDWSTDRIPPTVGLSPNNGATIGGTYTLAANVSDNDQVAGVQFKVDGANQGAEITVAPFQLPYDTRTLLNGAHTVTAVVRDRGGNTTTVTSNVTFNNAPLVAITFPGSGSTIAGTITLAASVTSYDASVTVQFKIDGTNVGGPVGSPFQVGYDTMNLSQAAHTFTAVATDGHGNATTSSVGATVHNVPPGIANQAGPTGGSDGDSGPSSGYGAFFPYGLWVSKGFTLQYRVYVQFQNSDEGKGINSTTTFNDGGGDVFQDQRSSGGNDGSTQNWFSPWVSVPVDASHAQLRVALSLIRDFGGSTITSVYASHIEYQWV